jgi:hypothetical protein
LFVERFGKERIDRFGQYNIGSVTAVRKIVTEYVNGNISYEDLKDQPQHIKDGVRKWRNGLFMSLAIALMADWDDEEDWKDKLSKDTQIVYDVDKYKYRMRPAVYYNIKSMVN